MLKVEAGLQSALTRVARRLQRLHERRQADLAAGVGDLRLPLGFERERQDSF